MTATTKRGHRPGPERDRGHPPAGLPDFGRCAVMGVVNVTPDSFSDGGLLVRHHGRAITHGLDARRPGRRPRRRGRRVHAPRRRPACDAGRGAAGAWSRSSRGALRRRASLVSVDTMRADVAERRRRRRAPPSSTTSAAASPIPHDGLGRRRGRGALRGHALARAQSRTWPRHAALRRRRHRGRRRNCTADGRGRRRRRDRPRAGRPRPRPGLRQERRAQLGVARGAGPEGCRGSSLPVLVVLPRRNVSSVGCSPTTRRHARAGQRP